MTGRLRVGIGAEVAAVGAGTGHGRTWHHVLSQLEPLVDLVVAPSRARARAVDVWLIDGHAAPPDVLAPVVSVVHDVRWTEPEHRADLPTVFLAVTIPETELAIAASTVVITPSHDTRDAVRRGYGLSADRVVTVPLGVDLAVFRPARENPVGPGAPYVLFVGAVEPRKRVDVVRDAVAGLARRGFPHRLVLRANPAQSLDSRRLLADATAELPGAPGRVVVLPRLDDAALAGAMGAAAALCLPSECEGFGLPVLEAMACGTPVVVADHGALPEVVGDAGLVVAPEPDAVEEALQRIATDAPFAAALGARARARAETMPWTATAAGYRDALERAAADRASSIPPRRALEPWVPLVTVADCPVCRCSLAGARPIAAERARLRRCPSCRAVVAREVLAPDARRRPDGGSRALPVDWPGVSLDPDEEAAYEAKVAADRLRLLGHGHRRPGRLAVVGPDTDVLVDVARHGGWEVVTDDDAPADVLVAAHVVNRALDATATVRDLTARVRPGGLILLEMPNWGSALRRRGTDAWHQLRPLEQVTAFDRASSRTLLGRAGVEPIVVLTRTRTVDDPLRSTHALPPLRRVLRATISRMPATSAASLVRATSATYDALGLGDVIVALARAPGGRPRPRRGGRS